MILTWETLTGVQIEVGFGISCFEWAGIPCGSLTWLAVDLGCWRGTHRGLSTPKACTSALSLNRNNDVLLNYGRHFFLRM